MNPDDGEAAIHEILNARDYYAAVDSSRDAPVADLRRCYLKKSLLVHPDKNKHPESKRAFQRLAAAWAVLGNDDKRRSYDAQLRAGRFNQGEWSEDEEPELSPEDAFAAFAFAAAASAAAGQGGQFADIGEALYWAQFMGNMGGNPSHMGQPPMGMPSMFPFNGVSPNQADSDQLHAAADGLKFSAGLWGAGAVMGMGGLPSLGGLVCRVALLQGITQAVMATQIPTVRTKLEDGAAIAKEKASAAVEFIGASETASRVRESAGRVRDSATQFSEQCGWSCGPRLSRKCSSLPSLLYPGSQTTPKSTLEPGSIRLGSWVRLTALRKATHLEGRIGEVVGFDKKSKRYQIRLFVPRKNSATSSTEENSNGSKETDSPTVLLVKKENVQLATEYSDGPPNSQMDFF